jgi:hypothetical protein
MDERYPCKLTRSSCGGSILPADVVSLEERLWNPPNGLRATCTAGDTIQALIVNYASVLPNALRAPAKYCEPSSAAPGKVDMSILGMDVLVEYSRAAIIEVLAFWRIHQVDGSRSCWRGALSAAYRRAGANHGVYLAA